MEEAVSVEDVRKIFKAIQKSFISQNQGDLTKCLRQFYREQKYDRVSDKDWATKISFSQYLNYPCGKQFSDILKNMKDYREAKAKKGTNFAFKIHLSVLSMVMGLFEQTEDQWIYKPLREIVRASKKIYLAAEKQYYESGTSGVTVKKDQLIYSLQRFKASRGIKQQVKREILPLIDNMQVSIMLRYHNYDQIKRILEPKKPYGEHGPLFQNNYYFQRGKVAMINQNMEEAEQYFERIKIKTRGQKRLVLRYLIPCKMFLGKMFQPKPENQDEYFPEYAPIIDAIIKADFNEYTYAIEKYQKLWIKRGIYLLMDRLRKIVWRNLIKRVAKTIGFKINIQDIKVAAKIKGGHEKKQECICIISNLIYQGYIKGYIYQNQDTRVLVLKKEGAFPKLAVINK